MQLGLINYKLIIPLVFPIFFQIRILIGQTDNGCYELFLNYLSYSFAGIIYLIVRYNTNKSGKKNITTNKQDSDTKSSEEKILVDVYSDFNNKGIIQKYKEEKKKDEKKELCKLKTFVVCLAFINLLPMSLEIIVYNSLKSSLSYDYYDLKESCSTFFVIIFFILFSVIFLKREIYNHQKFALIILSSCSVFIFFSYAIENDLNVEKLINIIFFSLIFCFYALFDVLGKKLFDSFMISPYYLMFSIGFVSLAILLPYEIITYLINPEWKYNGIIRQISNDFSLLFLLKLISIVVVEFFWFSSIWLTVYYFSPCHFIISESITEFLSSLIMSRFKTYRLATKIICYISYGIIIFSSLIYNEIIILNCEIISKDTKIYVIKRQINEFELAEKDLGIGELYDPTEDTVNIANY